VKRRSLAYDLHGHHAAGAKNIPFFVGVDMQVRFRSDPAGIAGQRNDYRASAVSFMSP
jgi:hypothetical protein